MRRANGVIALMAITTVIAVAALGIALYELSLGASELKTSRIKANEDLCNVIKNLVHIATPKDKINAAVHFIHTAGFDNCHNYAIKVVIK